MRCDKMVIKLERWFDYDSAVAIAKNSMLLYFREFNIEWNERDRLDVYRTCELWKALDQEQIGFALLKERDGRLYLADLQVVEQHRNRGYGSSILTTVRQMAKSRGYPEIWLKVFKSNPAYRFYVRYGCTLAEEEVSVYVLRVST